MFSVLLLVVLWLAGQSTAAPGPYWLALVLGSIQPLRELAPELARGRLSIDFLMLLAALGAGLIGHPGEGALLLILFNLAELLEERAMERTREGVRALVQKVPPQARRLRGNDWHGA